MVGSAATESVAAQSDLGSEMMEAGVDLGLRVEGCGSGFRASV